MALFAFPFYKIKPIQKTNDIILFLAITLSQYTFRLYHLK